MHVKTEYVGGPIAAWIDPTGPTYEVVQLNKTELATLTKAAKILEKVRAVWGGDDNHPWDTDVALAMYIMEEIVEGGGVSDF